MTNQLFDDPTRKSFTFNMQFKGNNTERMLIKIFSSSNEQDGTIELDSDENILESLDLIQIGSIIGSKLFNDPFISILKAKDNLEITELNVLEKIRYKKMAQDIQPNSISLENEESFIAMNMSNFGHNQLFIDFFKKEENASISKEIFSRDDIKIQNEYELMEIICDQSDEQSSFKPYHLFKSVQSQFCSIDKYSQFIEFLQNENPFNSIDSKEAILTCIQKRMLREFSLPDPQPFKNRYSSFEISKRDNRNIFDGCLSYLKNTKCERITGILPEGVQFNGEIQQLIGSNTAFNVNNRNYQNDLSNNNPFFEIHFGNNFIYPTSYSLMGRRAPFAKWGGFLKGWILYGLNKKEKWIPLDQHSNEVFSEEKVRTYTLKTEEAYKAFKIKMTEPDSNNSWALCIGQIEVFGDIFTK